MDGVRPIRGSGSPLRKIPVIRELHRLIMRVVSRAWGQSWWWSRSWQAGERQADAEYAAGDYTTYDNVEDFLALLDELMNDEAPTPEA